MNSTRSTPLRNNPTEPEALITGIQRQGGEGARGHPANQVQRQAFGGKVAGQYHWHIGQQHAQGRAYDHQYEVRVLGGEHHVRDLGLVAHLGEKERDQGGQEGAVAFETGAFVIVQLVRNQGPERHGDEGCGEGPAQGGGGEEAWDPVSVGAGGVLIGQGGDHYAGYDGPGPAKARGQQRGEQLGLVADFGQGNDQGGDVQRFHRT